MKWNLPVFLTLVLFFLSWGCRKQNVPEHSKSKWMKDYFSEILSGNYPRIHALAWWDENFDGTCLKINSSKNSLKTYREQIADERFITRCSFSHNKLVPVQGKIYHAAFPDFGSTEDTVTAQRIQLFEENAGKEIAWAYFSNNWLDSLKFPQTAVQTIVNQGKTPFIRIMFRSEFEEGKPDPHLRLTDLLNGSYDTEFEAWFKKAKEMNTPLLAEFGTEMNGSWFPWNGIYYGGGTAGNYGDKDYPDGPEVFRDAYRHIIDIAKGEGADNITWFFHFDVHSDPDEAWNDPVLYYPGDDYIDWIGVSTYGPFHPDDDYEDPAILLEKAREKTDEISKNKPCAILEFGITEL